MAKTTQKYRVARRGFPEDVPMIRTADRVWMQGDPIAESDLDAESWSWMLVEGVIEEGDDG